MIFGMIPVQFVYVIITAMRYSHHYWFWVSSTGTISSMGVRNMKEGPAEETQRSKFIEEMIGKLSPQRRAEVIDFIEFLLSKETGSSRPKMTCSWAGGLENLRKEYTSVELQPKASKWWSHDAISD